MLFIFNVWGALIIGLLYLGCGIFSSLFTLKHIAPVTYEYIINGKKPSYVTELDCVLVTLIHILMWIIILIGYVLFFIYVILYKLFFKGLVLLMRSANNIAPDIQFKIIKK